MVLAEAFCVRFRTSLIGTDLDVISAPMGVELHRITCLAFTGFGGFRAILLRLLAIAANGSPAAVLMEVLSVWPALCGYLLPAHADLKLDGAERACAIVLQQIATQAPAAPN